jgi:hypothetical protein
MVIEAIILGLLSTKHANAKAEAGQTERGGGMFVPCTAVCKPENENEMRMRIQVAMMRRWRERR